MDKIIKLCTKCALSNSCLQSFYWKDKTLAGFFRFSSSCEPSTPWGQGQAWCAADAQPSSSRAQRTALSKSEVLQSWFSSMTQDSNWVIVLSRFDFWWLYKGRLARILEASTVFQPMNPLFLSSTSPGTFFPTYPLRKLSLTLIRGSVASVLVDLPPSLFPKQFS